MTHNTSSKISILTLLVCMLPVAARRLFSQHNKLDSSPKTVVQHPLAEANHRNLQTDEEVCEFILNEGFSEEDRLFCVCQRLDDIYQVECRNTECLDCEIIQGVETCAALIEGVVLDAATLSEELFISCVEYESGLFNSTICVFEFEENGSEKCTMTADKVPCNSCALATCDDGFVNYNADCSNVPGGAVWNFCNADIPETSPFIAFGDNEFFFFDECFHSSSNATFPTEVSSSASTGPTASPQTFLPTVSPPTAPPTTPPTSSPQTLSPTAATQIAPPQTAPPQTAPPQTVQPQTAPPQTAPPQTAPPTAPPSASPQTAPPSASPQTAPLTASPQTSSPTAAPQTAAPQSVMPTTSPQTAPPTRSPKTTPPTTSPVTAQSVSGQPVLATPSMAPVTTPARATIVPTNTLVSSDPTTPANTGTPVFTSAPDVAVTAIPSRVPVTTETMSPSRTPGATVAPSRTPVSTSSPFRNPMTAAPSRGPVTAAPSRGPVTAAPSRAPVTVAPSRAPVTRAPSQAPTPPGDPTPPSTSSLPDENRSQTSDGFRLSVHTLLLVVSAAFIATFC